MALTLFHRGENSTGFDATHDFRHASGASALVPISGAAFDSGIARIGTYAFDYPTNNDYHQIASANFWDNGAGYENVMAGSFYVDTWTSGNIMMDMFDSATPNHHFRLSQDGTSGAGNLALNIRVSGIGQTTITLTGNNIALAGWYSVICRVDRANTTIRVELYNNSDVLIDSAQDLAVNSTFFPTTIDTFQFGNAGTGDMHMDNIFVADTYAEAIEDNLSITSYTNYGAAVASINTLDTPILDGEQDNAFTVLDTTGNVNEVLLGSVEGVNSIDVTASLTGSGLGPYTYDNDDVSAFTIDTAGLAFDSASWSNYLQTATTVDGSFQATIVINPAAGYKVIEALNPLKDAGHVYEDFVGIPVSTDQVLYESTNNTNNTLSDYFEIEADGTILTNITSGTIHCVYWDSAVTTWKPFDIIISSAGLFVTGSLSLLGVGG